MELLNFNKLNREQPAKGKVLISEPFLNDDYFKRSVVLLCEHNEEGTFGFVLNNFVDIALPDLIEGLPPFETRISVGGPVNSDNLYYIHTLGDKIPGSIEIREGIFMGGSFEVVRIALESGTLQKNQVRFFVGYSGWSVGQLEKEISENAWFVGQAEAADIMDAWLENFWQKILRDMGANYSVISNYPEDPNLN
jgi:putative transcriptional regulator